ncbi:zinc finger protein 677-like [Hyposmocoma kahamanoa]|uniref:zinc finger protein 677-like n=1 Tax=Hyposmocoma kahamanoa TaxID=1477025 RepID=UPI000E6D5C53|nr:zinc finger protein 677-like [Hyposmocoma kahamanoa]
MCTTVQVNKTDNLPNHICQNCLNLLNGCIMFRDLCQRSNKRLVELSIKKEYSNYDTNSNNEIANGGVRNSDDDDYNIPSPAFSDNSELWGCGSCNKEFYDMDTYNNHLNECKKRSNASKPHKDPDLLLEMKKMKSFLCDICGKTARSRGSLVVHMGIHENVFPFKCDECPYQGRTRDLLTVHKRSHLVDKPYKCSQCPKATTTASNLAKHMRHVHSTTRPYKCTYCDKAFSYQHDMKRHLKDIHLRQGTVDCDVCCKKFNTKKILQGHRWKVHKIKGERQGRLPSYLQYQNSEENDNNAINANNCHLSY